jgi:archaellum component FlaC
MRAQLYPLTAHLSDIGCLGFIENRNTLMNKVATFGHDVLEVKDRVGDLDAVLTEVKDQVSDVKDQVSDVKGQVSDVKGQVSDVKDQVSDVKDQVQLLVRLVSIIMMIILIRCVVLFLFSLSGRTEKNQTDL